MAIKKKTCAYCGLSITDLTWYELPRDVVVDPYFNKLVMLNPGEHPRIKVYGKGRKGSRRVHNACYKKIKDR